MAAAPKPTKVYAWASGDAAAIVEPSSGEILQGWVSGTTPPAQYMNALMGGDDGTAPWLQYLQTFEQNALTWPERQTFQKGFAASGQRSAIAGLDVTGGQTTAGGHTVDQIIPATGAGLLATPLGRLPLPSTRFQTQRHIVNASPLRYGRAYVTPTGFEFTLNAGWDDVDSEWVADDAASPAIIFRLTGSSIQIGRVDSPAAPFDDASFTERLAADTTTGTRGQALGYSGTSGDAVFSSAIRGLGILAGSTTFPWVTPGTWTTGDAYAWADCTGCGNITGAISADNATIQGTSPTVATLPADLAPATGAEPHGAGFYLPPGGPIAAVRFSIASSGIITINNIPANANAGTAVITLPCLHWRLTAA